MRRRRGSTDLSAERQMPCGNLVTCPGAQIQFCDLLSRFGISDPADSQAAGIGRAHLARQREGKLRERVLKELYCAEDNLFYDRNRETGEWNRIGTPACFMLAILHRYQDLLGATDRRRIGVAPRNILDMVKSNGFHENYNSQPGKAGTWSREHFSWSAASVMEIARRQFQ